MYSIQTRSSLNFMYFFYDSKKHGLCIAVSVGFFIQNIAIIFSRFSIETKILTNLKFFSRNLVRVVSQQRICRPLPPLRSGHLYLKDAQCTETKEKSYLRFLVLTSKRSKKMHKKCKKIQMWPNLQERSGLLWQWFFVQMIFFVQFLVLEIWSILYISLWNTFRS